jgi:hypothetical protein
LGGRGGLSEHEDDKMEVDDSTTEGTGINSRCCVLDIDIRGVEDKIWFRADYIRMFEFAQKFDHWTMSHNIYTLRRLVKDVDFVEVDIMTISPFVASKVAA